MTMFFGNDQTRPSGITCSAAAAATPMPNKLRNFRLSILIAILAFASSAFAQTSPLIMPNPQQQFFTNSGAVCSGCFIYTYVSGSFALQSTFTDDTGTLANTNPIVLNSAGYPQTSMGVQVGIWLQATATYRIVLQSAAHVTLWQIDGITGQFPGSTSKPISILDATCPQLSIGLVGFQTQLCFPAPPSS